MFITSLQYHKITITILADCINALASVIKVLTIRITIMKKKNKYCYGWAIWTNWGSGWEKESVYDKSCESILPSEERCKGIQNCRSTNENYKH